MSVVPISFNQIAMFFFLLWGCLRGAPARPAGWQRNLGKQSSSGHRQLPDNLSGSCRTPGSITGSITAHRKTESFWMENCCCGGWSQRGYTVNFATSNGVFGNRFSKQDKGRYTYSVYLPNHSSGQKPTATTVFTDSSIQKLGVPFRYT